MNRMKLEIGNLPGTRLDVPLAGEAWGRILPSQFQISSFHFRRSNNASSGVALIGIIMMIALMGMLGASVLMLTTFSSMESIQDMNWSKAFFAAETGISRAKAAWYGDLSWTNMGWIGNAFFTNAITTNAENKIVVSSTGIMGNSRWTSRWKPSEIIRAIIAYKEGSEPEPRYRAYSTNWGLSIEFTNNSVVDAVQWQRIEASPRTNEFLLVTQNDQRRIYAQAYLDGEWVSNTYLNAAGRVPAAASRGFDVAYESLSGRGMVVYSDGSLYPQYRIWTSTGWSSPNSINVAANGPIQWVRLVSKPGTNEIMCLARWRKPAPSAANYSSAIVWNGAVWAGLTNLETNCASTITYETFDAAYSTNSALVVYINGSSATQRRSPKYRVYTNGAWSAQNTMPAALAAEPRWIRVEYSVKGPTNRPPAAYAAFLHSSTRLQGAYYTNTFKWTTAYDGFSNATMEISTRRDFDIAWSSQTNTLMVVYSRQNQNAQSYMLVTNAGMQIAGSKTNFGSLVSTDDGQWCVLKPDPFTSEFYHLAIDDKNDVNFQRWTGLAWTTNNLPELEISSDSSYLSIDFSFRHDSSP